MAEAQRAGNSPFDLDADWVDYAAAGIAEPAERLPALVRALESTRLVDDVHGLGLRGTVPHAQGSDLADHLLEARQLMRRLLAEDPRIARLVEPFDPYRFNGNATLAENLLFGAPIGGAFEMDRIAAHPYVLETLDAVGLTDELRRVGLKVAETMVELFADLPPDHDYFRQFSFIEPEELPEYKSLIGRADPEHLEALSDADRERLLALPFKLIPERHRLGVVDDHLFAKLLDARAYFREHLPDSLEGAIAFFEPDSFNPASTIQENILFGKVAYGQAQAAQRIGDLLAKVVDQLDLRDRITEVGLQAPVGVGGGRLTAAQRQKLALARALLKRPRLMILYDGTANLDPVEQVVVRDRMLEGLEGRSVIWAVGSADWAARFEHVLALESGRIVAQGPASEVLDQASGLMAAK
jgi:energy-coupling factor transporter ATP-binding protein EcfA2